jgi:uncharacterized membrane protein YeaQ/YmgE (transglycosylase-associated protein family)
LRIAIWKKGEKAMLLIAQAQVQNVTVTFNPVTLVYWVVIGLIVGFLMGIIIRRRALGMVIGIGLGLIGALVGGFIANVLDLTISIRGTVLPGSVRDFFAAFFGAIIFLLIESTLFGYRHYYRNYRRPY